LFLKLQEIVVTSANTQFPWISCLLFIFIEKGLCYPPHQHHLHVQELATVLASMIDIRDKLHDEKEQLSQKCDF
jgi:hypothetical protein